MANKLCDETMTALILLVLAQVAHADTLADQAQALLDQGKAKAAHNLLDPHESERAGDVNFDLSFGIAAVDDGQNTRGVFALERVLAVEPSNARAGTEIARAYRSQGEMDAVRQEFEPEYKG